MCADCDFVEWRGLGGGRGGGKGEVEVGVGRGFDGYGGEAVAFGWFGLGRAGGRGVYHRDVFLRFCHVVLYPEFFEL